MTTLYDGHSSVDICTEPDGRVRMTVSVGDEIVAAPAFSAANFAAAIQSSLEQFRSRP